MTALHATFDAAAYAQQLAVLSTTELHKECLNLIWKDAHESHRDGGADGITGVQCTLLAAESQRRRRPGEPGIFEVARHEVMRA